MKTETNQQKQLFRKMLAERRRSIPPQEKLRKANVMTETVLTLSEVQAAEEIMVYASFGHEASTEALIAALLRSHGSVLLPYIQDGKMEITRVLRDDPMVESNYGPQEPLNKEALDPAVVEVVIVPGLGFDPQGRRIGYGRGFYDRFLARVPPHAVAIGFGFAEQLAERIPTEDHDITLHALVTDEGFFRIAPQLQRG